MPQPATRFFEIRKVSDQEVAVRFPDGLKVGEDIGFDSLLAALLKVQPIPAEVEGQGSSCCGDGKGACCVHV